MTLLVYRISSYKTCGSYFLISFLFKGHRQYSRPKVTVHINVCVLLERGYYLREGLIWGNTPRYILAQILEKTSFL